MASAEVAGPLELGRGEWAEPLGDALVELVLGLAGLIARHELEIANFSVGGATKQST